MKKIVLRKEIKNIEECFNFFKITFKDESNYFLNKSVFNKLQKEVLK